MFLGQYPCLEREPRGERRYGYEMLRFRHNALLRGEFLFYDVAIDTAVLVVIIMFRSRELFLHPLQVHRRAYDLRPRVLYVAAARGITVILEYHRIFY